MNSQVHILKRGFSMFIIFCCWFVQIFVQYTAMRFIQVLQVLKFQCYVLCCWIYHSFKRDSMFLSIFWNSSEFIYYSWATLIPTHDAKNEIIHFLIALFLKETKLPCSKRVRTKRLENSDICRSQRCLIPLRDAIEKPSVMSYSCSLLLLSSPVICMHGP